MNAKTGSPSSTPTSIYKPDEVTLMIPGYTPVAQAVPYGSTLLGVYFDGYPQLIKDPKLESKPAAIAIKKEKDIMVAMRNGVRIAVDVYRPDAKGKKYPAIVAWGMWGKDAQEAIAWNNDKPQRYYDTPFWDGTMEGGDYTYTVPRGFAHVIPEPRGIGNSEGDHQPTLDSMHDPNDIHDTIEWVAAQPWCNGKVAMMGPSSYSMAQLEVAASDNPPKHLLAIRPDEFIYFAGSHFHGMFDTLVYHIAFGRHGNDSTWPMSHRPLPVLPPKMWSLPKKLLQKRLEEALDHPDIKYNSKWYSSLKYPMKSPSAFDWILNSFHPLPMEPYANKIKLPMYVGTPWVTRLYIWGTFEAFETASTPKAQKKLIVYPPGFPSRPYTQYHDEDVRWYDYWIKGIDNGIMDEPPIKMFVMGVNKWKFESEWPLARTQWTKFYLHPQGKLSVEAVTGKPAPDSFTQPAPYLDPKVYCLKYQSPPMKKDMEVTGPIACYLDAAIDIDDTNWMVDLLDVAPDGSRQLLSNGYLKAKFRALDKKQSKPYQPIHPRQEPVPVTPGKVVEYAIQMMPTANVFKKGHRVELVIRNQDDILSRLGTWGVYMLPFMQSVTHQIHFGNSHLLLPLIPAKKA